MSTKHKGQVRAHSCLPACVYRRKWKYIGWLVLVVTAPFFGYRFCSPAVGGLRPVSNNVIMDPQNIATLLAAGDPDTWKSFLFNVDWARWLKSVNKETAQSILTAGLAWQGGGWTTSLAARALWQACGVPLVSAEFTSYRSAWLFALAQVWQLEVLAATLVDRAAEAAFHLSGLIDDEMGGAGGTGADASPIHAEAEEDDEEEDGELRLECDEPTVPLVPELLFIFEEVQAG